MVSSELSNVCESYVCRCPLLVLLELDAFGCFFVLRNAIVRGTGSSTHDVLWAGPAGVLWG